MDQNNYETIVSCIKHGAPALANTLVNSLNTVVENSNRLNEMHRLQREEARKKEEIRKDALLKRKAKRKAAISQPTGSADNRTAQPTGSAVKGE